jgi:hypothetical protein
MSPLHISGSEDENRSYITRLTHLSKQHQGEAEIVGPWSDTVSRTDRARICFEILRTAYKGTYSFTDFIPDIQSLVRLYEAQQFLTWLVYWNRNPVGIANIEICKDGIASLASSASIPAATRLPDGRIYRGQAKISAAMYLRIADLLSHAQLGRTLWAVEGDVRLTTDLLLSDGVSLLGGARSQHINRLCELNPFLVCVPRYHLHHPSGAPIQQFFMQSRKYIHQEALNPSETIYTPSKYSRSMILISDIVKVTYTNAWQTVPEFVDERNDVLNKEHYCRIENDGNVQFSTIHVSGEIALSFLKNVADKGLARSHFVEFILPNRPGNVKLQEDLLNLGAVALGALPGGAQSEGQKVITHETTIHYGLLKKSTVHDLVEIEMAREYERSSLGELAQSIRTEWMHRGCLK